MAAVNATVDEILAKMAKEDEADSLPPADVKIILLGDSAVGKSKLVERFLMNDYKPRQRSTYALTLYRHNTTIEGKEIAVDIWDTAGQERFASMHPSYYYRAHACILAFDVTRKATYKHLNEWYDELRTYCEKIPVIVVANKIDVDYSVTKKAFAFPKKYDLPFLYVSAADGANVVKLFEEAIGLAVQYKNGEKDFMDEVMELLDEDTLGGSRTVAPAAAAAAPKPRPAPAAATEGGDSDED